MIKRINEASSLRGSLAAAASNMTRYERNNLRNGLKDIDLNRSLTELRPITSSRDKILKDPNAIIFGVFKEVDKDGKVRERLAVTKPAGEDARVIMDIKLNQVQKSNGDIVDLKKQYASQRSWTQWLDLVSEVYWLNTSIAKSAKELRDARAKSKIDYYNPNYRLSKKSLNSPLMRSELDDYDKSGYRKPTLASKLKKLEELRKKKGTNLTIPQAREKSQELADKVMDKIIAQMNKIKNSGNKNSSTYANDMQKSIYDVLDKSRQILSDIQYLNNHLDMWTEDEQRYAKGEPTKYVGQNKGDDTVEKEFENLYMNTLPNRLAKINQSYQKM